MGILPSDDLPIGFGGSRGHGLLLGKRWRGKRPQYSKTIYKEAADVEVEKRAAESAECLRV